MTNPVFKFCAQSSDFLPANDGIATGYDVRANIPAPITLYSGDSALIPLGLKCIAPAGWWLQLNPRSSTFVKKSLVSLVGVIDQDYEGIIHLACKFLPANPSDSLTIVPGEKIAQLIPFKIERMDVVSITTEEFEKEVLARNFSRGAGGFGSTGN